MPPKSGEKKDVRIEVWVTRKQADYLDELVKMEGFGGSPPEVLREFAWDAINDLIAKNRLRQK